MPKATAPSEGLRLDADEALPCPQHHSAHGHHAAEQRPRQFLISVEEDLEDDHKTIANPAGPPEEIVWILLQKEPDFARRSPEVGFVGCCGESRA